MEIDFKQYHLIAFDCDGVLLDSNSKKTEAFYQIAKPYGIDYANKFINYHKENAGISRYQKFDYFFKDILAMDNAEQNIDQALSDYGQLCKKLLLEANLTEGVEHLLYEIPENITKIVVSGSDEKELKWLLKKKQLNLYFNEIYGSPKTKIEIFENYLNQNEPMDKVLFIGDSKYDFEVAKHFNFDFIFMSDYTDFNEWGDYFNKDQDVIKNFSELKKTIA